MHTSDMKQAHLSNSLIFRGLSELPFLRGGGWGKGGSDFGARDNLHHCLKFLKILSLQTQLLSNNKDTQVHRVKNLENDFFVGKISFYEDLQQRKSQNAVRHSCGAKERKKRRSRGSHRTDGGRARRRK